jgi:magnesium chelatase subunit H
MNVTVLYVGSSLLAPLKNAEREINRTYDLDLRIAAYNFGSPLNDVEWLEVERELDDADIVFVIHVMDGENAARLLTVLNRPGAKHHAVVVINCMPDLMRRTRMGRLDFGRLLGGLTRDEEKGRRGDGETRGRGDTETRRRGDAGRGPGRRIVRLLGIVGNWIGEQARAQGVQGRRGHGQYLKFADRLPTILRFVPSAGTLRDIKHYLYLFCYFLQPTPPNIRLMILYALKHYVPNDRLRKVKISPPEAMPSVAIYHPDAPSLFNTFEDYSKWYSRARKKAGHKGSPLHPDYSIGLLLMRPQVVSKTTRHYDALIRAIEAEGLSVIPAISTLMDNREACEKFFVDHNMSKVPSPKSKVEEETTDHGRPTTDSGATTTNKRASRVSQIVSLTGFSFVGGPAMNDSKAASQFLKELNRPYRSVVSLDMQTVESWRSSQIGLNPVQAGMQVAIPEIDGATEPFVYGGIPERGIEPAPLEDRCRRLAQRLKHWNRLKTAPRADLKLALVIFCFPPSKGNIGTAADLDVFPSVWEVLSKLKTSGYNVELPSSIEELRLKLLGGNSELFGLPANIAYRMNVEEYRQLSPYVDEVAAEWGREPGRINAFGNDLLIQGITLGNVFIGVQPTFGYEGDPMRLMMSRNGSPHHGFMAFYAYLEKVFGADVVIHFGTHGAMEFMPGKQIGLSGDCWPDRLVGGLPNIYLYSVNNPSEGTIAKRRSYAELISYLTPPIENAGLYKELVTLKDFVASYRQAQDEAERQSLFESIEECSRALNFAFN